MKPRQQALLNRTKARLRDAELAASGMQFYLAEYERYEIAVTLSTIVDERPPLLELDDEREIIDRGDDDEV